MTQTTLFEEDDPDKVPPKIPHNGTPTSRIAAKLAKTFASSQQEQVFHAIEQAGVNGLTDLGKRNNSRHRWQLRETAPTQAG